MTKINLNKNNTQVNINYSHAPVIEIIRVSFFTKDKNWMQRLKSAHLSVGIEGSHKTNGIGGGFKNPISLGDYIADNKKNNHILEIRQLFKLSNNPYIAHPEKCISGKVNLEILNLHLKEDEEVIIEILDSKLLRKRVDDWERRINNLMNQIKMWLKQNSEYELVLAKNQYMHEGLMKAYDIPMREIPTADIKKNGKIILSIKPFGLWIMGANGRVDLLSKDGIYILVDHAEHFQEPKWELFLINNRTKGIDFNQENFLKILA